MADPLYIAAIAIGSFLLLLILFIVFTYILLSLFRSSSGRAIARQMQKRRKQ